METQTKECLKVNPINPKNQKKNKSKDRKRLINLFRGPKVEHKFFRKSTEEESKDIKTLFTDVINKNNGLKLHQKIKKKKNISDGTIDDKESQTKTNDLKVTNDLVLGLNSIIRSIEKKSINGVILTNPLALPLENNIIELCSDNQIPCLSVLSFDEMKSCLNISSLSAIAFKPNVVSNESVFHELYEKFVSILDINLSEIKSVDPKEEPECKPETISTEKKCEKSVKKVKTSKSEFSIRRYTPLYEQLYNYKKIDDNYSFLMKNRIKTESNRTNDDFLTQKSLIKFSSEPELHFPKTEDLSKRMIKIDIILDEQQIDSNDNSFAQSLIESIEESDYKTPKGFKRKLNPTESDGIDYKMPRMVRLEPSAQKIQNRKHRKQLKRLNRSSKKS